jgi:hypothetical protein
MNLSSIEFLAYMRNDHPEKAAYFDSVIDQLNKLEAENAELKIENEELREL